MPSLADYLKFANLQMAAEAILNVPETGERFYSGQDLERALIRGNNRASVFTATQAIDFAAQWEILDQKANTPTGFSGTLFRNKANPNELVLSFRSTEFIDDAARDNKATNELEIAAGGFALGQIADMETWYKTLSKAPENGEPAGALFGQQFSVTGYSLGGQLATVFNQLRQDDLRNGPPPAALADVITFNGAGVGKIGTGSLRGMVDRFLELRAQAATADGLLSLFQSDPGRNAYRAVRAALASAANGGIPNGDMRDIVANAAGATEAENPLWLADKALLTGADGALTRALAVQAVAHEVPTLGSGNASSRPASVADDKILGEDLDYQLAVLTTRKEFNTQARSTAGGIVDLITKGGLVKEPGTPLLGNQYDVVGWEFSAERPGAIVAHSLWHYGNDVRLFIEDQPNARGGILGHALSASLAAADVRLLVEGFSQRDFGDDHSLVLLVDSLNVQNALLQLLPETKRDETAKTLDTILRNASWRKAENGDLFIGDGQGKAEGDVLENVVNVLADLVLGPQAKANRLNGNPDELKGSASH